jgi:hypothetical protein
MSDNPYTSPDDSSPSKPSRLADSRHYVVLCAIILAGITAIHVVWLFFNLTTTDPYTGQSILDTYPLFVLRIAVHGAACGAVTWRLIQYQAVLKNFDASDSDQNERLIAVHARVWQTIVFAFLAYVAIAILAVTFSPGGFLDR